MDVKRPELKKKKHRKRIVSVMIGILLIGVAWLGLSMIEVAAPGIDGDSIWIGTVMCGDLLREVRGTGVLEPEESRLITATTSGRVERRLMLPGACVEPDSVILELNNPQLRQDAENASRQLADAQTAMESLLLNLEDEMLGMEAAHAQLKANYEQVQLEADLNEQLFAEGLISELNYKKTKLNASQLKERVELSKRRLGFQKKLQQSQIKTQQSMIDQRKARYQLLNEQVDALQVRAGVAGVLQQLPVERGQQVGAGTVLAEVADPTTLKAVVKISESQARDVMAGQVARIDTRNGIIDGVVLRIDPTVIEGTVDVDVRLDGELPRGARPDLTIEGTIELERLEQALYVKRPAMSRENGEMTVFKFDPASSYAHRTVVRFGRGSVGAIEIVEGLEPGDRIILSDMSEWSGDERVRIKL